MAEKRLPNGLTKRQDRFARLRAADPHATNVDLARKAGYGSAARQRAVEVMKSSKVRLAIAQYQLARQQGKEKPVIDKAWIIEQTRLLVESNINPSQKLSGLKLLAEMTPGALVPVQVDHTGKITLEDWVASMGGAPREVDVTPSPPRLEAVK